MKKEFPNVEKRKHRVPLHYLLSPLNWSEVLATEKNEYPRVTIRVVAVFVFFCLFCFVCFVLFFSGGEGWEQGVEE